MTKIAVTSPTGKIGSAVCAIAADRNIAIRALVRDPARLKSPVTESAKFDFSDPQTYAPSLTGIDALILIAPSTPQQAEQEIAIVDAARAAGVRHVIKLSVSGAEPGGITFANIHQKVERYIASTDMPYTFLRPTFFMQNALGLSEATKNGVYPSPMGTEAIGQIDAMDIAAVALAAAVDSSKHAGKIYELTGPAALTGEEIAAALSDATGKPVKYVDLSEDEFRQAVKSSGADDWTVQGLVELYQVVRAGYTKHISTDVETVTGKAPTTFAAWAREAFATVNA